MKQTFTMLWKIYEVEFEMHDRVGFTLPLKRLFEMRAYAGRENLRSGLM